MGRACVPLFVLDRNEGFNLNCSWVQVPSRWGHPVRVECPYLCMYSFGMKVFTWFCLAMCSFAMGSPFYVRVAIHMYVLDRNEGFHLVFSGFVFLRDGVTLSGSRVHTCVCTRSKRRFSLGLSGIVFLHDGATLLGSNVHTFVCT